MDRGIQKVRQSIKQRKKNRDQLNKGKMNPNVLPFTASEEEKHGFFDVPAYDISSSFKKDNQKTMSFNMFFKAAASIGLFIIVSFLAQTNSQNFHQAQQWTYEVLQEEFPFAKVNEWYVTKFGSPLALTPQDTTKLNHEDTSVLPVLGPIVETFSSNGTGIMISPTEKTNVSAISRGVVIFAGNDKSTNKTIIVQHADGSKTTYGFLSSIDVHIYQSVQANQTIGTFQPSEKNEMVYFSIEKDNQFIDPSQVIPVENSP
ncbi:M23 family metallopeptidase [Pseudogracilibacillus sp. SE30717A]|uniref:M23 family metallopeptidase n=1 Tax=Pseudogracilibacillus sp. SE30717A TaxID=3098293 RepID=UPI00300DE0D6